MGVIRLGSADLGAMRALNALFADAFEDSESYSANPPESSYLERQLANPATIVLVFEEDDGTVAGGLVAYELAKLERARSEVYIYDLAVAETYRRRGIATALINELKDVARNAGAWVVYVQADYGDEPAIALYTKLGTRENVMHFDIDVETNG
ncbi:MAG: AAC(3)-I family aminoglycoside N-acetyltransferase [Sphingorhabdus sp.]